MGKRNLLRLDRIASGAYPIVRTLGKAGSELSFSIASRLIAGLTLLALDRWVMNIAILNLE
jgi:hypothetical protein